MQLCCVEIDVGYAKFKLPTLMHMSMLPTVAVIATCMSEFGCRPCVHIGGVPGYILEAIHCHRGGTARGMHPYVCA